MEEHHMHNVVTVPKEWLTSDKKSVSALLAAGFSVKVRQ